ncbi:MAG: hypothetical protein AAGA69_09585 [Pseudomonadota bacterium]
MTKTFATAAFTAFFTAAAAFHGAMAQVNDVQLTSEELSDRIAVQSRSVGIHLEMRMEEQPLPFADKIAALDNVQPGRVQMAKNTKDEQAETFQLALAY